MNEMTYKISNKKLKKIGFVPQKNLRNEIIKTLNLFNFHNEKN